MNERGPQDQGMEDTMPDVLREEPCREVETTLARLRAGSLDEAGREHARRCPDCAAALAVEAALVPWAAELRAAATPASADGLLWRARLQERIAQAERAARPVAVFDRLAVAVVVALAVLGLLWRGGAVAGWLGRSFQAGSHAPLELVLLGFVTVGFAGALVWTFGSWAEE